MSKFRNSKVAKITSGVVGFFTSVLMLGGVAVLPASAATVAELEAQIADLLSAIAALRAQLPTSGGVSAGAGVAGVPAGYTFSRNLTVGSSGQDVMYLQKVLNSDSATAVAASGVGSAGSETEYFGSLTKAAVVKWQNKYASSVLTPVGLTSGTGYVGPSTRSKLNMLVAGSPAVPPVVDGGVTPPVVPPVVDGGVTPPVVPSGSDVLTVTVGAQPSASLAPLSVARLPFTTFTVTAGSKDVTVNSVTVERGGSSQNSALAAVLLLDENGTQLGVNKTLNTNNTAIVGEAIVIKAGTSRTLTAAGNRPTTGSDSGNTTGLSVIAIDASSPLSGAALPIKGAIHTLNTALTIGTATAQVGVLDPNTSATKEIGTTAYVFSSIKVTAGSAENIKIQSVRWNQTGSVAVADLANIKTYVDGTAYDAVASSDGKYYLTVFPGTGLEITKGNSLELSVKGDIVGGSGRNAVFDINRSTDLVVSGSTWGYGITPSANTTATASNASAQLTTGTPWYDGALVTVSAGSITTISTATSVPSQNIAVNVSDQVLGAFDIELKGEAISVGSLAFSIQATGTGNSDDVDSVTLYRQDTNAVVAGPLDVSARATNSDDGTVTFTDTVVFPVGKTTYVLKGKLSSDFANNDTVQASTTPSSDWSSVTGQDTGDTISLSSLSTAVTMNTVTARAATTTVSVSGSPVLQTLVMGINQFNIANYVFDATQSGEDVRFNSVQLRPTTTTGASYPTNCFLYDGSTRLNNTAVNAAADTAQTFTLDNPLIVTKGMVKTVALKCDLAKNLTALDTIAWGVNGADTIQGTGITSGATVTATHTTSAGQVMTLASTGTLTVTLDPAAPPYMLVADGTANNKILDLRFHAANEAISLERVALQLTNTASSSITDFTLLTLWDGSTKVGEAVFTTGNTAATSTLSSSFIIPKDGDKTLTVKVDLAGIGASLVGTQGALIAVDYDGGDSTGTRGIGQSSGSTINQGSTSDTASQGLRVFSAYPSVAKLNIGNTAALGGTQVRELYRWSVTANGGDISLYKFTFQIATSATPSGTSSSTVNSLRVFAYTDSALSSPVSNYGAADGQLNATATDLVGVGTTDINVLFNNASGPSGSSADYVTIPAGATYYFKADGSVALVGGPTAASVSTDLMGDAAYPVLATLMAQASAIDDDAGSNDDFIWSPNATTTSLVSHDDWTNGYRVSGLPSSGLGAQGLSK